jgi:rhodanese-related sulfurtransferase
VRTVLFSLSIAVAATGCAKKDTDPAAATEVAAKVPSITVDELDQLLARHAAQPVDANGEGTRAKLGVIPGAVLLTDSDSFQLSELPADKSRPLVFYCANPSCGASHDAAGKAITAGYTSVKVLPDGIAGWVKAGKKTASIGS